MITMAQRIEALRTERDESRPALSVTLGFPKNAIEKFETGRQTPTKEQQEKLASYFGVSLFYLRGESNDRTRQEDWINATYPDEQQDPIATLRPTKTAKGKAEEAQQGTVWDALLSSKQVQDKLRSIVLDTLKSQEGQALIAKAVRKELESLR